jgi:iron(III) transport system substrate-binding protein
LPGRRRLGPLAGAFLPVVLAAACAQGADPQQKVVVYTSVDQVFSEPVLKAFEAETGIKVEPLYDAEAAKTTGLVNRLIAEKDRPLADVWWSGEFAQTIELAKKGILAPYTSPNAAGLPAAFADPAGLWTGFGGRARVFLVNTDRLTPDQYPEALTDLAASAVPADQVGMAHPVFGTAATHAAALYAAWGAERARAFYEDLAEAGVRVLDGNAAVRDLVASGELAWGITDTDDACGAVRRGAPVQIVVPDQAAGGPGTLVVPNTVALVAGAPNPTAAQAFIDYLLKPETEQALKAADWIQVAHRAQPAGTAAAPEAEAGCGLPEDVRAMDVPLGAVADQIEAAKADMTQVFVR